MPKIADVLLLKKRKYQWCTYRSLKTTELVCLYVFQQSNKYMKCLWLIASSFSWYLSCFHVGSTVIFIPAYSSALCWIQSIFWGDTCLGETIICFRSHCSRAHPSHLFFRAFTVKYHFKWLCLFGSAELRLLLPQHCTVTGTSAQLTTENVTNELVADNIGWNDSYCSLLTAFIPLLFKIGLQRDISKVIYISKDLSGDSIRYSDNIYCSHTHSLVPLSVHRDEARVFITLHPLV